MRYFDYSPVYYHSSFWHGGLLSVIINLAVWVAIIWLVMQIFRHFSTSRKESCCNNKEDCCSHDTFSTNNTDKYLNIVKERYAKGEIDKKQYEELKKDLAGEQPTSTES